MTIVVPGDNLRDLPSPGPTKPHLVMIYHDRGHQIITNPYKLIKIEDIDLKHPGYDYIGHLRSLMKPNLFWSNQMSLSHDLSLPCSSNYNLFL